MLIVKFKTLGFRKLQHSDRLHYLQGHYINIAYSRLLFEQIFFSCSEIKQIKYVAVPGEAKKSAAIYTNIFRNGL